MMRVQYSEDFNTFLDEQVLCWATNNAKEITICSRIESKVFKKMRSHESIPDREVMSELKSIHLALCTRE